MTSTSQWESGAGSKVGVGSINCTISQFFEHLILQLYLHFLFSSLCGFSLLLFEY